MNVSPLLSATTSAICDADKTNAKARLCRHWLLQAKQSLKLAEKSGCVALPSF
jgi:hypothetical protein